MNVINNTVADTDMAEAHILSDAELEALLASKDTDVLAGYITTDEGEVPFDTETPTLH